MSNLSRVFETEIRTTFEDASPDDVTSLPGPLRGTVTLILQTAFAQRLLNGRLANGTQHGLLGLFAFADLLRRIWYAAEAEDPYADWWLVKVERALAHAEQELQRLQIPVMASLSRFEALAIVPAASVRPVATALAFTTAQAFRGAQLIGRCDGLARTILTARHVGCMPAQAAAVSLWRVGHTIRSAFGQSRGFVQTGITRADLRNATPRAAYGVQQMGILPSVILDETVMPAFSPRRHPRGSIDRSSATHSEPPVTDAALFGIETIELSDAPLNFEDDLVDLFPAS